jgi:hypothetical protein
MAADANVDANSATTPNPSAHLLLYCAICGASSIRKLWFSAAYHARLSSISDPAADIFSSFWDAGYVCAGPTWTPFL